MESISILAPKIKGEHFNKGRITGVADYATLDQLAELITQYSWSPGLYKGEVRDLAECVGASTMTFDIDADCTLDQAIKLFQDYKHIIVTSRSHQKEKTTKAGLIKPAVDRFRLVLFPDRPVKTDAEFKATWHKIAADYPFMDPACKDISRFYYAGEKIVSINSGGRRVIVQEPAEGRPQGLKQEYATVISSGLRGGLSWTTKQFLIALADAGSRHQTMIRALYDIKEQGYTLEEATDLCQRAYELNGVPWGPAQLRRVEDIYSNNEVRHAPRWPAQIERPKGSNHYVPDPSKHENYVHFFGLEGREFKKNLMDEGIYLEGAKSTLEPLDNTTIDILCSKAAGMKLNHSKEIIMREINRAAANAPFHPLKDVINSAVDEIKRAGDNTDYIGRLIATMKFNVRQDLDEGTEDQRGRYEMYIEKWLVGCMAKLYRPGAQNLTLVFQGAQGVGKSRWLDRLSPWKRAFGEGSVDPFNKDHELRHLDKFIWHIPELESVTSKREAGALKDYLTKNYVSVRPAYGRVSRNGYSICNFCASVNVDAFLTDWTGNRRFLIVPVLNMRADHNVPMDRVFAQAKLLLDQNYQYWLDSDQIERLNEATEEFTMEGQIHHIANQIEEGDAFMTAHEIFERFNHRPTGPDFSRLSFILAKRGIKKARKKKGRTSIRGYLINKRSVIQK